MTFEVLIAIGLIAIALIIGLCLGIRSMTQPFSGGNSSYGQRQRPTQVVHHYYHNNYSRNSENTGCFGTSDNAEIDNNEDFYKVNNCSYDESNVNLDNQPIDNENICERVDGNDECERVDCTSNENTCCDDGGNYDCGGGECCDE